MKTQCLKQSRKTDFYWNASKKIYSSKLSEIEFAICISVSTTFLYTRNFLRSFWISIDHDEVRNFISSSYPRSKIPNLPSGANI